MRLPLITAVLVLLFGTSAFASTYYVDFASGSDSNSGTSTNSPWQHAPGMGGCTANCASASPGAGDQIILKGGVTWPNSVLTWNFKWRGSKGNEIYIGVDQSWYAGASWSRPVIDAGKKTSGPANLMMDLQNADWVTVDNLEFTGMYWDGSASGGFHSNRLLHLAQADGVEIKNCYFHGWSHSSSTGDGMTVVLGDTHFPNQAPNSSFHDNVIDGSDGDRISGACMYGGPPVIYNNVCRAVSNGYILNGVKLFHDNLIENIARSFSSGVHVNGFESNCDDGLLFYNNVVRHTDMNLPGATSPAGIVVWSAPAGGKTSYIFNNVIYDGPTTQANTFNIDPGDISCAGSGTGTAVVYNNTMGCGPAGSESGVCVRKVHSTGVNAVITNNHFITSNSSYFTAGGTITTSNNVKESASQAISDGFGVAANTAAYALPTDASAPTAGAGANLSSSCTGALAGLCTDTSYACSYNVANHTVSCPARTPVARPSGSKAWDVGAYSSGNSSSPANPPSPPTGLTVVVQ